MKLYTIIFLCFFSHISLLSGVEYEDPVQLKEFYEDYLNYENPNNWSPLSYALEMREYNILYYFLPREQPAIWKYKSSIQEDDVFETTPFHTAIRLKDAELLSVLLLNVSFKYFDEMYETRGSFWEAKTVSPFGLALYEQYCDVEIIETLCSHLDLKRLKYHERYTG